MNEYTETVAIMAAKCISMREILLIKTREPGYLEKYRHLGEFQRFWDYYLRLSAIIEAGKNNYGHFEFWLKEGKYFLIDVDELTLCLERTDSNPLTGVIKPTYVPGISMETTEVGKNEMKALWVKKIKDSSLNLLNVSFEIMGIIDN